MKFRVELAMTIAATLAVGMLIGALLYETAHPGAAKADAAMHTGSRDIELVEAGVVRKSVRATERVTVREVTIGGRTYHVFDHPCGLHVVEVFERGPN